MKEKSFLQRDYEQTDSIISMIGWLMFNGHYDGDLEEKQENATSVLNIFTVLIECQDDRRKRLGAAR